MNVKERVRELAKIHGLSVPTLESKLKFSSGSISKWDKSAPGSDKLEKVADFFNVTTDYLLGKTILSHCSICNSSYDPINHESISEHHVYHDNYLKVQEKYGKVLPYLEASKLRNDSIMKFRNPSASLEERVFAYEEYLKYDYMLYLLNNGLDLTLEDFDTYCKKDIGLAETKMVCDELNPSMYDMLVLKYGPIDDKDFHILSTLNEQEKRILSIFNDLSKSNKAKTLSYAEKLFKLQEIEEEQELLLAQAAHARTDSEITEEMNQHDDDIMNNDSEWE